MPAALLQEDFGDGGAFPDIHVAQYPNDMGRATSRQSTVVALQTGEDGKLQYDAILRQGLSHRLAIHTRPESLKPLWSKPDELQRPSREEELEEEGRVKEALQLALNKSLSKGVVANPNKEPEYINYTPNANAPGHNANCKNRVIRMVDSQVDPLEPPKFKHKRIPRGPPSPPPAILHSPPRKLSAVDQAEWKIPPCVSNWKNQKGYTIPLDKRLQADGRLLQNVTINDKFASLSEALYIAERAAREEIRIRNDLLKQKKQKEEVLREQQLRTLAAKARAERSALSTSATAASDHSVLSGANTTTISSRPPHSSFDSRSPKNSLSGSARRRSTSQSPPRRGIERPSDDSRGLNGTNDSRASSVRRGGGGEKEEEAKGDTRHEDIRRGEVERERKREIERELRLERAGKKAKRSRDEDRDISERIALGQAKASNQESLFDARLFNQTSGMDSGYSGGDDEKYNIYDKPLFVNRAAEGIYKYNRDRMEQNVGDMSKVPSFSGADSTSQRTAPVEFEKDIEDPFGLESLIATTKKK